jgi:hypothetical protein
MEKAGVWLGFICSSIDGAAANGQRNPSLLTVEQRSWLTPEDNFLQAFHTRLAEGLQELAAAHH